eukprot:gene14208-20178_t
MKSMAFADPGLPTTERDSIIFSAYEELQSAGDGSVELEHLKTLAKLVDPSREVSAATKNLPWLDGPASYGVSLHEFTEVVKTMGSLLPDDEVRSALHEGLHGSGRVLQAAAQKASQRTPRANTVDPDVVAEEVAMEAPPADKEGASEGLRGGEAGTAAAAEEVAKAIPEPYFHPTEAVVPTLREGLIELLGVIEADTLNMAAGKEWIHEEGNKFLPQGWRPFSPHRWLAEWIMARLPPPPVDPTRATFVSGSRQDKVAVVYSVLESHAGEPLRLALDYMTLTNVYDPQPPFQAGAASDSSFDLALVRALAVTLGGKDAAGMALLPKFSESREARFTLLFLILLLAQQDVHLQQQQEQPPSPASRATEDVKVSLDEFVAAMSCVLDCVSEESGSLDQMMQILIERPLLCTSLTTAYDPTSEVEPTELADMVRELPSFSTAKQVGFSELESIQGRLLPPVILLDTRRLDETEVSMIPGALHVAPVKDEAKPGGWSISEEDMIKVRDAIAQAEAGAGVPPAVVAYCSIGGRSGGVATMLTEALGIPVDNLCGGIISYYNQGGTVHAAEGRVVQSVHPGRADLVELVGPRPNGFRLEV